MNLRLPLLACLLWALSAQAAPVQTPHVEAELIAENSSLQTGAGEQWVALRLKPEAGWHVYWRNPGDSGIPTSLSWTLPAGVTAGEIQWPYPHRESLGTLTNYGYSEDTLHLVPLTLGSQVPAGPLPLHAKARWLVCSDICIPGSAELDLSLPVSGGTPQADARWTSAFASARAALPVQVGGAEALFAIDPLDLSLSVSGLDEQLAGSSELEFFAYDSALVTHSAAQRFARDGQGMRFSQSLSPYLAGAPAAVAGVLVVHGDNRTRAYEISALAGSVTPVPASKPMAAAGGKASATGLLGILGLALLGGLILNLMPCVFPVLSLKALSVMKARGESDLGHLRHALIYTLGVLCSFAGIALALIALRSSGAVVGWGFQLQSPVFVAALVYVLFALGLSLSGLVQFGTRWMGAGQSLAEKPGYAGSFFTGVLAVVVASPCTAPFMGTAMGYALTQSPWVSLAVFLALGLGLALPFLLLGLLPRLAAWLPRPGVWMEHFKQLLAFPMYLTAVWLLWVLGGLTDRNGMALALVGLVLLAFALWLLSLSRWTARAVAVLSLAGAAAVLAHPLLRAATPSAGEDPVAAGWEPYSDARFEALRAEGRTVFVDFTADWCLTCKVNERVALRSQAVQAAFAEHNVALLVGDWTAQDDSIAAVLHRYGRDGVPLYLVSRKGQEPEILPQLLTPGLVIKALTKAS